MLRDFIKAALRILDLRARRHVDRRIIGDIDDLLADHNEIAANGEIVNRAAIVGGVDDGGGLGGEARQILRHCDAAEIVVAQKCFQRHDRGDFPRADKLRDDFENPAVQFFGEMFCAEKIRNAVKGVVIDEDGAEQRLLRLHIMRRRAVGGVFSACCGKNRAAARHIFDSGHGFIQLC